MRLESAYYIACSRRFHFEQNTISSGAESAVTAVSYVLSGVVPSVSPIAAQTPAAMCVHGPRLVRVWKFRQSGGSKTLVGINAEKIFLNI